MSNKTEDLDEIDQTIIKVLQENSRATLVEIAKEVGELTENAIRYRIDRLEDDGYISDYTIRLNPKKFGKNVLVIFNLNVLPENIEKSLEQLQSIEALTEIYLTTGDYSIVAIGLFNDNNEVTNFITEKLKKIIMINFELTTVLKRVKHGFFEI
jgi:Lrp/AsnC family transcriptional regulator for asnA, asnC and gidA